MFKALRRPFSHFHLFAFPPSLSHLLAVHPYTLRHQKHSSIVLLPGNPIYFHAQSNTHLPSSYPLSLSLSIYPILSLIYTALYVYLHNQIAWKSIMKREKAMHYSRSHLLFGFLSYHSTSMASFLWPMHSSHSFNCFFSPTHVAN